VQCGLFGAFSGLQPGVTRDGVSGEPPTFQTSSEMQCAAQPLSLSLSSTVHFFFFASTGSGQILTI
jgi:hypothetical protein